MNPVTRAGNQRWMRQISVEAPIARFDPGRHSVQVIGEAEARAFVRHHHYSGSYPAARFRVGLFRSAPQGQHAAGCPADLAGVAVFSVPMNNHAIPKYCGVDPQAGVELGRFVLLDECERNAESWFLARAFELLRAHKSGIRAVLSYSDPVPRRSAAGQVLMPGHYGCIYQAHNARYIGRSAARQLVMAGDGTIVSERSLSKLRNGEQGAAGAYARLIELGAPRRRPLEGDADYVARALLEGPFTRVRHPGNHAYLWAVGDRRERARVQAGFLTGKAYPKIERLAA